MAKGSRYERRVCKLLSEWWSGGKADDLFWRSSQSGGRATSRSRRGKKTRGHYGDVCATDSVGEPFTKLFTVEIKCGYANSTPMDFIDHEDRSKPSVFENFVTQAKKASKRAGTKYWLLIHKRNGKKAMVYFPGSFVGQATRMFFTDGKFFIPYVQFEPDKLSMPIACTTLDSFFDCLKPKYVKALYQQHFHK